MNDEDLRQNPLISLRSLLATIRQKRRVWLATGLVGLILGASLHLLIPHKYSAVTNLYLVPAAGADPNVSMANNVSLLQTEAVAKEAVTTGHLPMSPLALLSHYDGLGMSDSIMSIKFSGASQNGAVSGAKAVAQAFLTVQAGELGLQTNGLLPRCPVPNLRPRHRDQQPEYADQFPLQRIGQRSKSRSTHQSGQSEKRRPITGVPAPGPETAGSPEPTVRQRRQPCARPGNSRSGINEEGAPHRRPLWTRRRTRSGPRCRRLWFAPLGARARPLDSGVNSGRSGRVEPWALPPPSLHAKKTVGSPGGVAKSNPAHDRTAAAGSSRICARVSPGSGHRGNG